MTSATGTNAPIMRSRLDEIERQIEAPAGEIDAMCLELVAHAIDDESYLRRLKIPDAFWPLISKKLAPQ